MRDVQAIVQTNVDRGTIPFLLYGIPSRIPTKADGLFYVANSSAGKVMELSSYGDLIFLLYDPRSNPPPISFSTGASDDLAATRKALAAFLDAQPSSLRLYESGKATPSIVRAIELAAKLRVEWQHFTDERAKWRPLDGPGPTRDELLIRGYFVAKF